MTYNEFVKKPNRIRRTINHKIEEVMFKESICMRTTASFGERVQTSPSNTQEKNYLRYIDAKNDLNELVDEFEIAQSEVRDFLYGNLSFDDADILEWRYIDGKTPQEIADKYGATYQATWQRIKRANEKAREKYNKGES